MCLFASSSSPNVLEYSLGYPSPEQPDLLKETIDRYVFASTNEGIQ